MKKTTVRKRQEQRRENRKKVHAIMQTFSQQLEMFLRPADFSDAEGQRMIARLSAMLPWFRR
jgi:hypothetical protein